MARSLNSRVRTPEQVLLESLLCDEETVTFGNHHYNTGEALFRHKPTASYFTLRADASHIYFTADRVESQYSEVVAKISAKLGSSRSIGNKLYWEKPKTTPEQTSTIEPVREIKTPDVKISKISSGKKVSRKILQTPKQADSTHKVVPQHEDLDSKLLKTKKQEQKKPELTVKNVALSSPLYQKIFSNIVPAKNIEILKYDSAYDRLGILIRQANQEKGEQVWLSMSYKGEIQVRARRFDSTISTQTIQSLERQFGLKAELIPRSTSKYQLIGKGKTSAAECVEYNQEIVERSIKTKKASNEKLNRIRQLKTPVVRVATTLPDVNSITTKTFEMSLSHYLCETFYDHPTLKITAYDSEKKSLLLREVGTHKPYVFGVGFGGKCIYLRQFDCGLNAPLSETFVKGVALRAGSSKFEFSASEKAHIWYVDGLIEKFPEIKK